MLLSSTKFLLGIGAVYLTNFSFVEAVIFTSIGGILGVLFYLFLFHQIIKFTQKKGPKIKFSKWRRFMIRIKQKGGLWGVAALTPILLSIPLGIALSLSLQVNKKNIALAHIICVLFWSLALIGLKYQLGYSLPI